MNKLYCRVGITSVRYTKFKRDTRTFRPILAQKQSKNKLRTDKGKEGVSISKDPAPCMFDQELRFKLHRDPE